MKRSGDSTHKNFKSGLGQKIPRKEQERSERGPPPTKQKLAADWAKRFQGKNKKEEARGELDPQSKLNKGGAKKLLKKRTRKKQAGTSNCEINHVRKKRIRSERGARPTK
jgi:hypothetical protein